MPFNYTDIMQSQWERLEAEQAAEAAELEAGRIAEDGFRVENAARRILELDAQRSALAQRANQYASQLQGRPQGNSYGLSDREVEVAKNWTSDPAISTDDRLRTYAEQKQRYQRARMSGEYRDDQGRVTR
jgi:hypothetical protein